MPAEKRQADTSFGSTEMVVKRQKAKVNHEGSELVQINRRAIEKGALMLGVPRTAILQAPLMEMKGHTGEVFAARFDPSGAHLASGSMDSKILLWGTVSECPNYGTLSGHKGAIMDLSWSRDGRALFTASADATVASWDTSTGQRIRRHEGHLEVVNSLCVSRRGMEFLVTGSDDGWISMWDPRQKYAIDNIPTEFPITAVALAEAGNELYSGGIDNDIKVWDVRKKAVVYTMQGHTDTISSLEVSPDAQSLLSYSHDGVVRTWDIRPFAPADRSLRSYAGASMGLEKNLIRASWDIKGQRICCGCGDATAVVWDATSAKLLYKLPGHKGTVNDVRFSPREEFIIVSASSDHSIFIGEL